MTIKSEKDFQGMSRAGRVVAMALRDMTEAVRPGITTAEVDIVCAGVFDRHGARAAPNLVYGFPGVACISVNDEAVHGVPGTKVVQPGDLVKLDVTAELDGYFADAAVTVAVPTAPASRRRLARCAESALQKGLLAARAGRTLNAIGRAVETEVTRRGFSVISSVGGHGVGRTIHEEPSVPSYYAPWLGQRLQEGLVLAIEPVISAGSGRAYQDVDGWTVKTSDGSSSAHFEHTIVITRDRPIVLTAA